MSEDQIRRISECAFDEDITEILGYARWSDDDGFDALVHCIEDIRNILSEARLLEEQQP